MRNITILLLILSCVFAGHIQAQTEFSKTGTQWKVNRFCYGIWNDTYINDDYSWACLFYSGRVDSVYFSDSVHVRLSTMF